MLVNRKRLGVILTILLLTAVVPLSFAGQENPADEKAGGKVAEVNGTVISKVEFDKELGRVQQRFMGHGRTPTAEQLKGLNKQVLDNLIGRELLLQETKKQGIVVDEAEYTAQLETIKKRFPSEEQFKKMMKKMKLSDADIKTQIKQGMAIEKMIDKNFVQKLKISDEEVKKEYDDNLEFFKTPERVRASHILIKVDASADKEKKEEARKKLEGIRQRLKKGEDFAALAKEFSDCPSGGKGGDLGLFGRGQMVKPFEEAAFALKPNEVSDIVETMFGFHLIKVVEKKDAATVPFAQVKERIAQQLKQQKVRKTVDVYVQELKKKGDVKIFPLKD